MADQEKAGNQHRCPKCNQTFASSEELRKHDQERHKEEHSTPQHER